jgi:AcrR family transcriptional regulator
MRTHGWKGAAPEDDAEAIERILKVTRAAIDANGRNISITAIANELGVTRQTVYRYFPSVDELLLAAAMQSASTGFLDLLAGRVTGISEPAEAVVEGIATTLESLPFDKYISVVLTPDHAGKVQPGVTSGTAISLCHSMLQRLDIDWTARGYSDEDLDELAEYLLRILQSYIIDPGRPPRRGAHLRRYLRTWVSPAVDRPPGEKR